MRAALRFSGRRYVQKRLKSGHALLQRTVSSSRSVDGSSTARIHDEDDRHVGCPVHFAARRSVRSSWTAPIPVARSHEARGNYCIRSSSRRRVRRETLIESPTWLWHRDVHDFRQPRMSQWFQDPLRLTATERSGRLSARPGRRGTPDRLGVESARWFPLASLSALI